MLLLQGNATSLYSVMVNTSQRVERASFPQNKDLEAVSTVLSSVDNSISSQAIKDLSG